MIQFGTKAETLERLSSVVKTAKILPQIRFTVAEWYRDPDALMEQIRCSPWYDKPLIVRSSGIAEDSTKESLAGHFLSVSDVAGEKSIRKAVSKVIESFGENRSDLNQVFIQPMLENVILSGVGFSRDPSTGGFYIVIEYDDSGSVSAVTSGLSANTKTYYYFKYAESNPQTEMRSIVLLINELEHILNTDAIDIEFAITDDNLLYLLQVRPLVFAGRSENDSKTQQKALKAVESRIRAWNRPHPYLHGTRTVYGVMPDWNPAEIIGVRPRPLSLSLYKEIITDNIWAYQRDNYGYGNLRSFPLLISFCGLPYIDVRVSFNSFVPKQVKPALAEKLINYYIERLIDSPSCHDKVEFEIVYSCYTLDLKERMRALRNHGFSDTECNDFTENLRVLTNNIIHGETGLWRKDIDKIRTLEQRQVTILESDLDIVSKIYWLLEDYKRYGTLPFAGLARAGFIAVQLLNSLVNVGILNETEYQNFMQDLDTVGSRMASDFESLSKKTFLSKYGHLRPGTYDIISPRYDEEPEQYFDWSVTDRTLEPSPKFMLSIEQLKQTERILKQHRLEHDVIGLFDFIKAAIEGREYSKFVFTRSLSDALSLFKKMAGEYGFSDKECAYADINCIRQLYASSDDAKQILEQSMEDGIRRYDLTCQLTLPPIITQPEDIWSFHIPATEPNFITLKRASGHVTFSDENRNQLYDSILMVPGADPGYDWIFSCRIAGFITMYGGVNSHMAIRAGELGVPAVIGAGETLYKKWAVARTLEIDAANKQVRILR